MRAASGRPALAAGSALTAWSGWEGDSHLIGEMSGKRMIDRLPMSRFLSSLGSIRHQLRSEYRDQLASANTPSPSSLAGEAQLSRWRCRARLALLSGRFAKLEI